MSKILFTATMLSLKEKEGNMDEQRGLRMGRDGTCLDMPNISLLKALHCTRFLFPLMDGCWYDHKVQPDISLQCLRVESWLDRTEELKPHHCVSPARHSLLVECIYSHRDTSEAESNCGG